MSSEKHQDFHNRNEWRAVGMSRSGNHAIIQWLLAQAKGRTCFLNCTEPKNNPFARPRCLGPAKRSYFAQRGTKSCPSPHTAVSGLSRWG
jgi:hypothetical protein